jgi:hypothetical protein
MTVFRRSWGALVLPPRRGRRPLCSPRVMCLVREGVAWMAIASYDRRLGGGVAKGAPEPDGTGPPSVTACGVAEPDVPAPAPVGSCGVATPDVASCASASTAAATANASWKSSIIARCCSRVGWVTCGAPDSCVPPISSAVPPNKSANRNSSGGVSPW